MGSKNLIEKLIYSLSHDLRSPVASIQGLVRIAEYYPRHHEIDKCLEMIGTCTHKMDKLISTLQQYMINDQRQLVVEAVNPEELIGQVVHDYVNQLDACGIVLETDVSGEMSWTMDKQGTCEILKHLIANAIAYHDDTKTEKKIIIRLKSGEQGSLLEVIDNGKGIAADQQKRIFDVFFKGTSDSIGEGMGLFLVKGLAEKMGGELSCTSVINAGTSIRLSFKNQIATRRSGKAGCINMKKLLQLYRKNAAYLGRAKRRLRFLVKAIHCAAVSKLNSSRRSFPPAADVSVEDPITSTMIT